MLIQSQWFWMIWFSCRQSLQECCLALCLHGQCREPKAHQIPAAFLLRIPAKELCSLSAHSRICCDECNIFILLNKIRLSHQTNFWLNSVLPIHRQAKSHVCPQLNLTCLKCTWFLGNPFNSLIYSKFYSKSQFQGKQNLYPLSLQIASKQLCLLCLFF